MNHRIIAATLLSALALWGCEQTDESPSDFSFSPPAVSHAAVSPTSLNIDSLDRNGDTYAITVDVSVRATDPDGRDDLASVRAEALRPGEGTAFALASLHDDGVTPDAVAGDSVFSGVLVFSALRSQAGLYRIRCLAFDGSGLRSTTSEASCRLTRNNARPVLDTTSFQGPDTLVRPPTGSIVFAVSIAASDSDGLSDIQRVFLRSLSTGSTFPMFDDGNPAYSGDTRAGDGVFTAAFAIPSDQPAGTRTFLLQAVDSFQDSSDSFFYTLVLQ
jgi:hypothetical protein